MPGTSGGATCAALAVTSRLSGKSSPAAARTPGWKCRDSMTALFRADSGPAHGLLHARPLAGLAEGTRGVLAAWMLSCLSSADVDLGSCFGLAWPGLSRC